MADPIDEARQLIHLRLSELEVEATELERALAGLGEDRRSASQRGRTTGKRKTRAAARAPRGQRREQLLGEIKVKPGISAAELAREIGISANQVHGLIKAARKDKLLVKKGK